MGESEALLCGWPLRSSEANDEGACTIAVTAIYSGSLAGKIVIVALSTGFSLKVHRFSTQGGYRVQIEVILRRKLDGVGTAHYPSNSRMKSWIRTLAPAALCLVAGVSVSLAADEATLFRVFLRDGSSLVSYGEFARVGDRVVFSMPTAATPNPPLQLVNIPDDRVDWDRTNRYAESARADRYVATQAEADYVELSGVLTKALNEVSTVTEPNKRLALIENARRTLAEWSQNHYNYRQADVQQMVSMLDEAIADLRASAGGERFNLSFVSLSGPTLAAEPLLPPPTPKEAIEQVLSAARLSDSGVERKALLNAVVVSLNRDKASLPAAWTAKTRTETQAAIAEDLRIDRAYQAVVKGLVARAERAAQAADVRGVQKVLEMIQANDAALGRKRPDEVANAMAAVGTQLTTARQLRLVRDRWALRAPVLQEYNAAIASPVGILQSLDVHLKDIRELAGSSQTALNLVRKQVKSVVLLLGSVVPPEECRSAHALLGSAAQLADQAAQIRREATLSGDVARAWDASAAAAGALMLSARAKAEIQASLKLPQLQ
jgi:hypothetical protein